MHRLSNVDAFPLRQPWRRFGAAYETTTVGDAVDTNTQRDRWVPLSMHQISLRQLAQAV